jgi:RNAse (barnase) inhibitor barstar
MTSKAASPAPRVFRIDGRKITSVEGFYREVGRAVNGPGGYFGDNLDALADCLRGGFGTPETGPFEFDWSHSDSSKRHLADVRRGQGTFIDAVRNVFDDAGVVLKLR